jgi:hypothetical protein
MNDDNDEPKSLTEPDGYNPKADHRLITSYPPCMYCKHLIDPGSQGPSGHWTCVAFPKGIPQAILTREQDHETILDDQEGSDVYESQEVEYYPGRTATIDFAGNWSDQPPPEDDEDLVDIE